MSGKLDDAVLPCKISVAASWLSFAALCCFADVPANQTQLLCREGKIHVKFGSGKTEAVQDAEFVDSNTIK